MASKHSCKKYDLMIDDYIDGLLSDKEREELEAHLAQCEECRRTLRFSIALRQMIRVSAEEPSEDMHKKIMESVGKNTKNKKRGKAKIFRLGAVAAACALICLTSAALFTLLPGRQAASSDTPSDPEYGCTEYVNTDISASTQNSSPDIYTKADPTDSKAEALPEEDTPFTEMPEVADTVIVEEILPVETEAIENEAPGTSASAEMTDTPDDESPSDEAAEPETAPTKDQHVTDTPDPSVEAAGSDRPGGEEITLALLIVSGLLAVASFIAFLISLSSVRTRPTKKE